MKVYKGDQQNNIVFPLGGIGAGSIGIAGNGMPVDCEILNHPNREAVFGYTNFAIKAEDNKKVVDYRILCGDSNKDFVGTQYNSYGYGNVSGLSGIKHFSNSTFRGEFPLATLSFSDSAFPANVKMEAFNPFIPSNEDDSSLPAAFYKITVKNNTNKKLKYSVALSATNPFANKGLPTVKKNEKFTTVTLNSAENDRAAKDYGNMSVSTNGESVSYQRNWFRGGWKDALTMFINDFSAYGEIKDRSYDTAINSSSETATIYSSLEIEPECEKDFIFIISWFVPNFEVYWLKTKPILKNYYSTVFDSSYSVAEYCFSNFDRLYNDTLLFKNALMSSSLPAVVTDAIQGNLAILKSTTCLRLENGDFWGWEGVNRTSGSCHGTCEHVWNYAYALAFLFPRLERSIRNYEFDHSLLESGKMYFRTNITMDGTDAEGLTVERACVDGQMGSVMKAYREWKISGDTEWLKSYWPKIKKALEYAWSDTNPDKWDRNKTGIITGRQHHTLDMELFGASSWLTGFYHGALLAAREMATAVGDNAAAKEYALLFEKGKKLLDSTTFSGEYYIQNVDIEDEKLLEFYTKDAKETYWCEENGQIKYQISGGCEIDQVVANWHSDLMGLEDIFVKEHRKSALKAIYKNNFRSMHDYSNAWRVFACNNETGLIICTYPENAERPKIPLPYADECMTGFEYAAACNMLQCGMEEEALNIVSAVRSRYDGKRRNPWSELECGASYSRAMASYSFLLTYSGFKYDLTKGMIGFKPLYDGQYFWSVDGAFGTVKITDNQYTLKLLYGNLHLKNFVVNKKNVSSVSLNKMPVNFSFKDDTVRLDLLLSKNDVVKFC